MGLGDGLLLIRQTFLFCIFSYSDQVKTWKCKRNTKILTKCLSHYLSSYLPLFVLLIEGALGTLLQVSVFAWVSRLVSLSSLIFTTLI